MTQPQATSVRKFKVLIADDIQETRRNTRLMLSTIPNVEVVAIAIDGRQAIELARQYHPDLFVTDINMPEVDGLSAYKEILKTHPLMSCIIMSAQRDENILLDSRSVGVREYLVKPFTLEELEAAVQRVTARLQEQFQKMAQAEQAYKKSEEYLLPLAEEYARTRRTDDEAMKVFEQLATNPKCKLRWLQTLAMVYVIRQEWAKLKMLSARLEQRVLSQSK